MEFKEIWGVFAAIDKADLPIAKKGNMGLDYLSWAHALHLAISEFPELTFNCDKEKVYDDGTMMVYASVTISDHTREMWLPVMDNRNNAIVQANARQISDNKMRCLVKCLALFGLGLNVYAGEDLNYLDEATPEQNSKPKENAPKKKTLEEVQQDLDLVASGLKDLMPMHDSYEGLVSFWKENKKNLDKMKEERGELYEDVLSTFKERAEKLKGEEGNG
jgi:hypothetical protein